MKRSVSDYVCQLAKSCSASTSVAPRTIWSIRISETSERCRPAYQDRIFRVLLGMPSWNRFAVCRFVYDLVLSQASLTICVQLATHFKKIRDPSGARPYLLTPCAPSHAGAIEMDLFSIKSEDLCPMDVTVRCVIICPLMDLMTTVQAEDFRRMTLAAKPSVGEADLARYVQWTEEFGQEG